MGIKKSVFFTLDSILASAIIIFSILLVSNFYSVEKNKASISYASRDIVMSFSNLKIGDFDNDLIKNLIESGEITDYDNTILEQIGELWAEGSNLTYNLSKNITEQLIPKNYGFSVLVDGEEVYSRNTPVTGPLVSSRKIMSGITKAKPTDGFTARASLKGIKSKKTSSYLYFGGYEGDGNLTKIFELPKDIILFNGSYMEADAGSSFDLYINGLHSGYYALGTGGSNKSSSSYADKWNISSAYLANFASGKNRITINFTGNGSPYIAGGFLKVTYITSSYNDTFIPGYSKEYFPGVDGAINIYSSSFMPESTLNYRILLNYSSPYQIYMSFGNAIIYLSNSSPGKTTVYLNSSNLSDLVNISLLSKKTIPFRIGFKDATFFGQGSKADAVLATDRTGSMNACDVPVPCISGLCDSAASGGCHDRRDNVAVKSGKKFVESILNTSGNSIGLVGFGESLQPYCDFHEMSSDNQSLQYRISNYSNSFCGYTCISCGVLDSTKLLIENKILYGLTRTIFSNTSAVFLGDSPSPNFFTQTMNLSINKSKIAKSRLTVFGKGIAVNSGYQDCVYINNKYIGRLCDSAPDWHTCSFPLKTEWLNEGKNNVTITGGTTSGCFATSGDNDEWDYKDFQIVVWQSQNETNSVYNYTSSSFTVGDSPKPNIASVNLSLVFNSTAIKSAMVEFEAINISVGYYDCLFVNGNYIGRIDDQRFNGTNTWQKVIFDIPALWIKNGTNQLNFTSGTTSGCKKTSGTNNQWSFKNINLSIVTSYDYNEYDRYMSMLVMSDGDANTIIGGSAGADSAAADTETIQKACEAKSLYGINIYTVVFGPPGSGTSYSTLNQTACCDDCSNFYAANDSESLTNIYTEIANSITSISFQTQSVNITGGSINKTQLFPSSSIEYNYTYSDTSHLNKIPLRFETGRFGNNISNGTLFIYPNTTLLEAKVTSYSGSKWTDKSYANGALAFNLSLYGDAYQSLGDPFIVDVPSNLFFQGNNTLLVSTGFGPQNYTGGSADNRAIYTLLLNSFIDYSAVSSKSSGCAWSINFEDGSSSLIKVPSDFSGTATCNFAAGTYDADDAIQSSAYALLSGLDLDGDGLLDVNIESGNLDISTLTISKVPSLWGPAIIEIRVWE